MTRSHCNVAYVARLPSAPDTMIVGLCMVAVYFLRRVAAEVHIAYRAAAKFKREIGDENSYCDWRVFWYRQGYL
jgi:hypothetical protein